jgi:hypothetical protein
MRRIIPVDDLRHVFPNQWKNHREVGLLSPDIGTNQYSPVKTGYILLATKADQESPVFHVHLTKNNQNDNKQ